MALDTRLSYVVYRRECASQGIQPVSIIKYREGICQMKRADIFRRVTSQKDRADIDDLMHLCWEQGRDDAIAKENVEPYIWEDAYNEGWEDAFVDWLRDDDEELNR